MTDFGWDEAPKFALRDYQRSRLEEMHRMWPAAPRQLLEMATGTGKTGCFGQAALLFHQQDMKTLVLANRSHLVEQTAERIRDETGLNVDVEMDNQHASPYAPVVVASVQTFSRIPRLTGFAPKHFGLVVEDEAHLAPAATWLRVRNYFFWGEESLVENWKAPTDPAHPRLCKILGCTATPEERMGPMYDHRITPYPLLEAIEDGWLVPLKQMSVPIEGDLRGLRLHRTNHGADFNPHELEERIAPLIDKMAAQLMQLAPNRKTIAFLPGVKTAEMFAKAVTRLGLNGIFVSGDCLDKNEKTKAFYSAPRGTVLANCALVNFGIDFPDVDCVFHGSPTRSKTAYRQRTGRSTRVLRGILHEGLTIPAERQAAIALSDKPDSLILDPLFIHEKIDLCEFYDLVADTPEVKKRMKEFGGGSMSERLEKAERDEMKALEKQARAAAKKEARVFNPVAWAVSLGQDKLAAYTPETSLEAGPIHPEQIAFLAKNKIDASKLTCYGQAAKVISTFLVRLDAGLATPGQLDFLAKLGVPAEKAALMKAGQAGAVIQRLKRERGWA